MNMERKNPYGLGKYLTVPHVAEILQVDTGTLTRIVEQGIVMPIHDPAVETPGLWGPGDIFRAFLGLRLAREFEARYGRSFDYLKYDEVRRDLFRTIRAKGQEILKSEEWGTVVKRAANEGLFFSFEGKFR